MKLNQGKTEYELIALITLTAQKMKFSIKDFFGKRDQIRCFLGGKVKSVLKVRNGS